MIKIAEEIDLENYTLILPSVAVGNVGQLCVDLIISSLNLDKIGSSWNPMFIPICGLDPYRDDDDGSSSLCTTADLYIGTSRNIILFQLRSPYVGNSNSFFDELSRFIRQKKISKTVILTSSYDYERADRPEPAVRYLTTDASLIGNEKLVESLCWTKHTKRQSSSTGSEAAAATTMQRRYIPGGGFASALFEHLESIEIPCTVLFCYCSEGDNVSDALILFKGLNGWLNFTNNDTNVNQANDIKYPPSWEYFFGNPPSAGMY
ncbi:proteasome assembly chaperone 2 [Ceratina calcarata]|uniref:Proteasome assembly chaperone 2 n=1 Tax=Ceratina calcarata TaxID=156304 RepID=A0AAJ7SBD2_9HYME|nr:proteasome assembly chaperone 2 [Ceratina calcarata]XP_026674326.1 proteasome assembly chaperone 2 [Ceratina calcarata]XP_026674327.1 proteasome assembly chaperone 2 [Ceratina calcarata]